MTHCDVVSLQFSCKNKYAKAGQAAKGLLKTWGNTLVQPRRKILGNGRLRRPERFFMTQSKDLEQISAKVPKSSPPG